MQNIAHVVTLRGQEIANGCWWLEIDDNELGTVQDRESDSSEREQSE